MDRYKFIKNIVQRKYYKTLEEIVELIDYMVIMQKINFEQGQELNFLANDLYTVVEETVENTEEIVNVEEV